MSILYVEIANLGCKIEKRLFLDNPWVTTQTNYIAWGFEKNTIILPETSDVGVANPENLGKRVKITK